MKCVGDIRRIVETYVYLRGIPQVTTLQLDSTRYVRFRIPHLSSFRKIDNQRASVEIGGIPGSRVKFLISYTVLFYMVLETAKIMDVYHAMRSSISKRSAFRQLLIALLNCDLARDLISELSGMDRKDGPVLEIEKKVLGEIDSAYLNLFRELADKVYREYEGIDVIRELLSKEDDLFVTYGLRLAKDYMERKAKEIGAGTTLILFDESLMRVARLSDSSPFNREMACSLLPPRARAAFE